MNLLSKKLFGKGLFEYRKPAEPMYDFAQNGLLRANGWGLAVNADNAVWVGAEAAPVNYGAKISTKSKPTETSKKSPKELYKANALNDHNFVIKIDPHYLDKQIKLAQDKLALLGKEKKPKQQGGLQIEAGEWGPKKFSREELRSIIQRLKNRKRIKEFQFTVDEFPHTTTTLINEVLNNNSHLQCEKVDLFIPDFPKDAVQAMKKYDDMCVSLCNQKAVFYVIADQGEFIKNNKKRDPILLAQSPFGFFWQVLGAWDEEMVYLGDL